MKAKIMYACLLAILFWVIPRTEVVPPLVTSITASESYETVEEMVNDMTVMINGLSFKVEQTNETTAKLVVDDSVASLYEHVRIAWLQTSVHGGEVSIRLFMAGNMTATSKTIVNELIGKTITGQNTGNKPNSYDLPEFARTDRDFVQDHTGFMTDDGKWIDSENIVGTIPGDNKIDNNPLADKKHDIANDQTSVEVLPPPMPEVSVPVPSEQPHEKAPEITSPTVDEGPILMEGEF